MKPKHANGKPDDRYTVSEEYIGKQKPQWVSRWCGDWLGYSKSARGAWGLCTIHQHARSISQ